KTTAAMIPYGRVSSATLPWCSFSARTASAAGKIILTPFGDVGFLAYRSAAHLPGAAHEPLRARQLGEAHRAARVELLRRDAELRAEAELTAIAEPGGRVRHDDSRVDLLE